MHVTVMYSSGYVEIMECGMADKGRNTQYDILDKILADSDLTQRVRGVDSTSAGDATVTGARITTKEQFDELYKSVDDLERYLRS
jgi:hypothetical protein